MRPGRAGSEEGPAELSKSVYAGMYVIDIYSLYWVALSG